MFALFAKLYGGLKVGYLKRIDVFYSLTLALLCTNVVEYLEITLINRWFLSVWPMIEMTGIQLVLIIIWIFGSRYIYSGLYRARRLLVIYGDRDPGDDLIHKMNSRKDKYDISGKHQTVDCDQYPVTFAPERLVDLSSVNGIPHPCKDRLTLGGKPFKICKFRSMCVDSEKNGARLASKHDSRITPVGHVLRNLHLDELPQLFNVFKGDMSLVGPRPERESIMLEYEKELPEFYYRLKVKAGLTGYAQVYGKYNTTPYDKLKLDLFYIENYSFLLDIKLIFMTVKIFFQKEVSEGVDDRQVNALKDSGKNAGVSENKTEE